MKFRGQELADAYQAKRDLEEKDKVMEDIQAAMNSKDTVALGRALKEAERLNIDEVKRGLGSMSDALASFFIFFLLFCSYSLVCTYVRTWILS